MGTVSTSGSSVSGLSYIKTYYLYPVLTTNYKVLSWEQNDRYGTISSTTEQNPSYTIGLGNAEVTVTGQPVYMQDLTKSMCKAIASDAPITLKDKRDNQDYTARYINTTSTTGTDQGTCWMTQNLRFGYNAANPETSTITLTAADSNVSSDRTLTLYDVELRGKDVSGKNQCWGSHDSSTGTGSGAGYTNPCVHSGTIKAENTYDGVAQNTVWYNYAFTSAGTITGDNNIAPLTESICPKGWTIPSVKQFNIIGSGSSAYVSMFSPVLGGGYNKGLLYNEFARGYWWVIEADNDDHTQRYLPYYDKSSIHHGNNPRVNGHYIRCVSDDHTIADLTYMQDMTSEVASNTADGTTATLIDRRDNKSYNIAKINGNVWMTENLRFGYDNTNSADGSTVTLTLTPQDSNVSQTRTIKPYDLETYGKTSSQQCWGTYNSSTGIGYGPAYQYSCIHSGVTEHSGGMTVWYNYALATAGTIIDENTSSSSPATNTTEATESICPKGWMLPSKTIIDTIGGPDNSTYVLSFTPVLGGYYYTGALNNESTRGLWHGSTAYDATKRYGLNYNGSTLYTWDDGRRNGQYVRCTSV